MPNYKKFADTDFFFHHDEDIVYKKETFNEHYHNLFEIYFITKGTCTYFIDNKVYDLIPGDIVLIPEGVMHDTKYKSAKHSRMLINCSLRYIPSSLGPAINNMLYLYRNPNLYDDIYKIFTDIEKEYNKPDEITDDIFVCYVNLLFFTLVRNENFCKKLKSNSDFVQNALEYVQNNFNDDISLTSVAQIFNVSPEHLSRTFKKQTGFGFNKYLTLLRLKEAETLLKETTLPINEIASRSGFSDGNYFSLIFKKFHGLSPKEVRRNFKKLNASHQAEIVEKLNITK